MSSSSKPMAYLNAARDPNLYTALLVGAQGTLIYSSTESSQIMHNLDHPGVVEERMVELTEEAPILSQEEITPGQSNSADASFSADESLNSSGVAAQGRKTVSGTKRAAQNRIAQKAFRQRRDKYVKDLEATVAEVSALRKRVEKLERENTLLREYTMALQSRLLRLNPSEPNHERAP